MTIYQYQALSADKKMLTDVIESTSWEAAYEVLQTQMLTVINLKKVDQGKANKLKKINVLFSRYKKELLVFTQQLSTLLNAKIPLVEALGVVIQQCQNQAWKKIVYVIKEQVQSGVNLSAALANFPRVFSHLYCQSVQAAEQAGYLPQVLENLNHYLEQQQTMRNKIIQAIIYPVIMISVSFIVIMILLLGVMPKIIPLFTQQHQTLPIITQILMTMVDFLNHYWWLLLILLVAGIVAMLYCIRKPEVNNKIQAILLKMPLLGDFILLINMTRFTSTLSFLLLASVPLLQALKSSVAMLKSKPIKQAIQASTKQIENGLSISQAIKTNPYFSPLTLHLISSGDATGQLGKMLAKAAEYYQKNLEHRTQLLLTLFEPLMILIMGSVVLFIVLAVLLPIFSLDQLASLS